MICKKGLVLFLFPQNIGFGYLLETPLLFLWSIKCNILAWFVTNNYLLSDGFVANCYLLSDGFVTVKLSS